MQRLITDSAIIQEMGDRITQRRISMNLTQEQLAVKAGIGKSSVERIESGKSVGLGTLIRLLRALELLHRLDALVPAVKASPLEQLNNKTQRRKRVRSTNKTQEPWTWGDEP